MQSIKSSELIKSILKNKFSQKEELTLWQNYGDGKRAEFEGKCYRYDDSAGELWFLSKKTIVSLEKVIPIYGVFKERNIIFKSKIRFYSTNKFSISIPDEIQLQEGRQDVRETIISEGESINYNLGGTSMSSTVHYPYSANIYDRSLGGLAVLVNSHEVSRFIVGDTLRIKAQGGQRFSAMIVHTLGLEMIMGEQKRFRIGLKVI